MNKKYQTQCLRLLMISAFLVLNLAASAQWLKASGKKITDENGDGIILRGMGLGGWMLQEPYMMEMGGFAGTQWQIKAKIQELIGASNTEAFYDAWHANHCSRADIDSLASWGFNSVRLPMHYNLYTLPIEDEPVFGQNTWLEKGFAMTDSLVKWCSANHIYVILDLHAAPGGQGKDYAISDGNPAKPSLWDSEANQNKTIALWRKLAERYANEPWVGAYDLINEPNWSFTAGGNENGCSENSNAPLLKLYKDITNTIRQVDTKHLIIIEGNCWGNNYNGISPSFDSNIALSFHKYWSNNDQGAISGIINLRNQYNVPIWLGESGENSNVWFADAIQLVESNDIGWAWWPLKKIGSVVGPLTIVKTANYETLLNYWNNGGTAPSASFAYAALMQMAENAKINNCIYHKDVIDAMFRQVHDSTTIPFKKNVIPGRILASDFDLGRVGKAYWDTDVADYHVSSGTYSAWNLGWTYRNDAVDIGTSFDPEISSNINYVGWTKDNEWLQYTADVDSTATYLVKLRYSTPDADSKIRILVNDADVTGLLSLLASGGYQTWASLMVNDVILYKGKQRIKVLFEKGGANLGYLSFTLQKKTEDVSLNPVWAETFGQSELIYLSCNKTLVDSTITNDGFSCTVNGNVVVINSIIANAANPSQIILSLGEHVFDIDDIKLSYTGGAVAATDGTLLGNFTDFPVKNNLPVYTAIPGLIQAEDFTVNNGLVLENCTDAGGGQNLGYTSTGDYLDYHVRVLKTSKYTVELRVASNGSAGRVEFDQLNSNGAIVNVLVLNTPQTGGWQAWQTISGMMDLTEGICTLRVKILQPEFNMNWFRFTESSQGVKEDGYSVFTVYPNPASDEVSVIIPGSAGHPKTIVLRSITGSLLKTIEVSGSEVQKKILVGDLPKGLYIVELEMTGKIFRSKLILN
jgi:hypothetical protein